MTNPELIAHLLKQGGRVLVAGGGISDILTKQQREDPRIVCWDDEDRNFDAREVPSNVRAIIFNRWISHQLSAKLAEAAKRMHIVRFPMLRTREIKTLLEEAYQTEAPEVAPEVAATAIAEAEARDAAAEETTAMVKEAEVATTAGKSRGFLQAFIAKHMNLSIDYSVKGSIAREGDRLLAKAKTEGVKTTQHSMRNALAIAIRNMGKARKPAAQPTDMQDDFAQLDRLIEDAITAMKLVQEHLPKVRKETERLRGMRERMLKLLE